MATVEGAVRLVLGVTVTVTSNDGDGSRERKLVLNRVLKYASSGVLVVTEKGVERIAVDFFETGQGLATRTTHAYSVVAYALREVTKNINDDLVLELRRGIWPGVTGLSVAFDLRLPEDNFAPGACEPLKTVLQGLEPLFCHELYAVEAIVNQMPDVKDYSVIDRNKRDDVIQGVTRALAADKRLARDTALHLLKAFSGHNCGLLESVRLRWSMGWYA